jgi:acyl-CoA synthetase (AMP-forming)/AMP-acid ligase II
MTFRFGGTLVLERSFAYPAAVLKRMEEEKITGFPGVPTIFAILLQMNLDPYDFRSLRYMTNTAAALPRDHVLALRRKFHWVEIFSMYGLTECKRALYLPPEQLVVRPDSVGIPIPGTAAWIEDEHGNKLGAGEVGELVCRGPNVMLGYHRDPEGTKRAVRDGWLYTGDMARVDHEGFFYIVDRQKDMIISGGENIYPREVEEVILTHPAVDDAAVIGVPDPVWGESVKAFIVLKEGKGVDEQEIIDFCKRYLASYKKPKRVAFVPSIPKNSLGKVLKRVLRERE